ncbi:hypothetical protein GCM10023329_03700 [Streptomyces sanyensis]|uniref:Uncharacterized protein n=1 Tax=Streptomyces sanyensis TaxID=568869 RepID=A0ABP8ZPG4_9ACTN
MASGKGGRIDTAPERTEIHRVVAERIPAQQRAEARGSVRRPSGQQGARASRAQETARPVGRSARGARPASGMPAGPGTLPGAAPRRRIRARGAGRTAGGEAPRGPPVSRGCPCRALASAHGHR